MPSPIRLILVAVITVGAVVAAPSSSSVPAAHGATPSPSPDGAAVAIALSDAPSVIEWHLEKLVSAAQRTLATVPGTPSDRTGDSTPGRNRKANKDKPSHKRKLKLVKTINQPGLSPKSIVADQNGQVFTMNMMYNHNITVFNRRYKRKKVIDDSIDLSKFGFRRFQDKVQGAPVEAAVSPDGKRVYVSNYAMYGPGFKNQGFDLCERKDRIDRGFVYVINTKTLRKTDAIQVGELPKYLAIAPNGRHMLVGNWCSWDISVVDLKKNKEIRRIEAGVAPRGIAFSPNGKTAFVTLVGEDKVLAIDMKTFKVKHEITGVGERPRHLVMSPDGRYLYITAQGEDTPGLADGRILKYDTRKRRVVDRSRPLVEPRTTVMSDDGKALYVVDYHPGTIVKLRTNDLFTLQEKYLGYHPIGVTYVDDSDKLWVSGYGGTIWILKDK